MDEKMKAEIRGAVRELDPAQIAISRRLTAAQRFSKMVSMIEWAERTGAYRLRLQRPDLSEIEALRMIRSGQQGNEGRE